MTAMSASSALVPAGRQAVVALPGNGPDTGAVVDANAPVVVGRAISGGFSVCTTIR